MALPPKSLQAKSLDVEASGSGVSQGQRPAKVLWLQDFALAGVPATPGKAKRGSDDGAPVAILNSELLGLPRLPRSSNDALPWSGPDPMAWYSRSSEASTRKISHSGRPIVRGDALLPSMCV